MMMRWLLCSILLSTLTDGFVPRSAINCPKQQTVLYIQRIPILRRFARRRRPIQIGKKLPNISVDVMTTSPEGTVEFISQSILEVFKQDRVSVLVGMPGAFTETCDSIHLPGFVTEAPNLAKLGVGHIAVVTTNDVYVNKEWALKQGLLKRVESDVEDDAFQRFRADSSITLLSDGGGDLVKALGLAQDIPGAGLRSNRFVMVINNGIVRRVFVDEGMDKCSVTAAGNLVDLLTPKEALEEEEQEVEAIEVDFRLVILLGAVITIATYMFFSEMIGEREAIEPSQENVFQLLKDHL